MVPIAYHAYVYQNWGGSDTPQTNFDKQYPKAKVFFCPDFLLADFRKSIKQHGAKPAL